MPGEKSGGRRQRRPKEVKIDWGAVRAMLVDMDISRGVTLKVHLGADMERSPIWDFKAAQHEAAVKVLKRLADELARVGLLPNGYKVLMSWTQDAPHVEEEKVPEEFAVPHPGSEKRLRFRKDVEVIIYGKSSKHVLSGATTYEGVETDVYTTYRGPDGERRGLLINSVTLEDVYVTFDVNKFVEYLNSIGVPITYDELKEKLTTSLSY